MGWVVNAKPHPLYPRGRDPVPIVQEAGWAPVPVCKGSENLASTGTLCSDRPACRHSLYRLGYPGLPVSITLCERQKKIIGNKQVKVKSSRHRSGVAQRVGRGIALLFHDRGTRRGWVVSSMLWLHFTPRKDPVPILQEAGWAPGPVWTGGKSRPTGIRSRAVQPVVSHYTDWANRPTLGYNILFIKTHHNRKTISSL